MYWLQWWQTGGVWTWIKQDVAVLMLLQGWLMLRDDSQGHYMTVKLMDAIHRGVIFLLTGPPPSTMMKYRSDECIHTFPNLGLFLGWTAIFQSNYVRWVVDHQNWGERHLNTHWRHCGQRRWRQRQKCLITADTSHSLAFLLDVQLRKWIMKSTFNLSVPRDPKFQTSLQVSQFAKCSA